MIPFPTAYLWAGAAVVAASGFALAGAQTIRLSAEKASHAETKLEYSRLDHKALTQAVADRDAAQGRADQAAKDFEAWKATQRPRVVTIKQEIRNAQAADVVCRDRPLPDGLRDALKRAPEAVGARNSGEPGAVPSVGPR